MGLLRKKGKKVVDRKALLPFSIGVSQKCFLEAAVKVGMAADGAYDFNRQ